MFNPFRIKSLNHLFNKAIILRLIILLGIISLLADIATNGARSIIGPYFAVLGASATIVGVVAGFGEFIAYSLRIVSGYFVDRYKHYWTFIFIGYLLNLVAVPLLALAGNWQIAAMFLILERMGKAIRAPCRDAVLSYASQQYGRGRGFGLHKMLDQIGAMMGPLIVAIIIYFKGGFRLSFLLLAIPALLALVVILLARYLYQTPQQLETTTFKLSESNKITSGFWLYTIGASLVGVGYADFPLIAFHFEKAAVLSEIWIPSLYAIALGFSAIASLLLGRLYDKNGLLVLILVIMVTSLFSPFVFLGHSYLVFIGMILWGIGMGSQIALMKAVIAGIIPMQQRGFAYGVFNAVFGLSWFLGSATMGVLYSYSLVVLVVFSVVVQLTAVPLLLYVKKQYL